MVGGVNWGSKKKSLEPNIPGLLLYPTLEKWNMKSKVGDNEKKKRKRKKKMKRKRKTRTDRTQEGLKVVKQQKENKA